MSIGDWMDTPQGGRITGYAFGFGAAVVIVGALFKIQHWPGAAMILTAGMGTEAVLFCITAFGNPHKTYHWDNVFPQLAKDEEEADGFVSLGGGSGSVNVGGTVSGGGSVSTGLGALEGISALSEEDIQKLSAGISKLSETAAQLSDLSSVKGATDKLVQSMTTASESVSTFTTTQQEINSTSATLVDSYKNISTGLSSLTQSSGEFVKKVDDINKNLSSINAVYEIQLKVIDAQTKSIESVEAEWTKVKSTVAQSASEIESYRQETTRLTQQVVNLNNVYGSMLSALS
ncbi:MAG: gliding motility protein GldL [Paludibacteraceae bacterium]|nr:gliding motility protein GldL [Paludibacteraceae bacterium]